MTDELNTKSPEEQLNDMLRTLLAQPGVKEKASSLLNIVQEKTPVGKKETISHSVRNYISVEVTTVCLTCEREEMRTVLFSKKESTSFTDKAGNVHVINFNNIDVPTHIRSYSTTCPNCKDFIKTLSRERLEEMFISLSQVSSVVWSAFRKQREEIAKRPPEPLDPIKFPPIKTTKRVYELSDEEFQKWLSEPEEDNCGENFTEGLRTDTAFSGIDDTDDIPDGESVSEILDKTGDTNEHKDDGENPFPWIACLSSQRDASGDDGSERGDSESEDELEKEEETDD